MATVDVTRIASNIGALNALNSLQMINAKLAMHQTRLSTGKRINSASDDPAGLTIATKMLARSEGLKASIDNISDAKNMLSVAEAGLSTMTDIMIAMRTSAEKAASDTLGNSERATIQTQLSSYAQQIQELVDSTKWNGVKLLDNTTGAKIFQTGVDSGETTTWTLPGALDPGATGLNLSKKVTAATVTAGTAGTSFTGVPSLALSGASSKLSELSTGDYAFKVLDQNTSTTVAKLGLDVTSTFISGVAGFATTQTASSTAAILTSGRYSLTIDSGGSTNSTSYTIKNLDDATWNTGGTMSVTGATIAASGDLLDKASGTNIGVTLNISSSANLVTGQSMIFEYIAKGERKVELQDSSGQALQILNSKGTLTGSSAYTSATNSGTRYDSGRGISTYFAAVNAGITGDKETFTYEKASLYSVNVSTASKGGQYMNTISTALDRVTSALSDLGALMARLTYKEEQSATAQVNIEGAYSRIMNANMAEEQLNASKYTILQQTATAMLAQANAAPQSLLALFR